jgi:hypothetical protein
VISTVSESEVDMLPAASLTQEYRVLVVAAEVAYIERRSPNDRKEVRIRVFCLEFTINLFLFV